MHTVRTFVITSFLILSGVVSISCGPFRSSMEIRLKIENTRQRENLPEVTEHTVQILRNRLDQASVSHRTLRAIDQGEILVEITGFKGGSKKMDRIRSLLTGRGQFDLRFNARDIEYTKTEGPGDEPPAGYEWVPRRDGEPLLLEKETHFSAHHIEEASSRINPNHPGAYMVSIRLDKEGTEKFARITAEHTGRRLAMVMDGTIYSAPKIQEEISEGQIQITGNFSEGTSTVFAVMLMSDPLPAELSIVSKRKHKGFLDQVSQAFD